MSPNGMGLTDFMKDVDRKGADFIDWKDDGKLTFFLHPGATEFFKRRVHWLPHWEEVEKGSGKKKRKVETVTMKPYICPNEKKDDDKCPVCRLRNWLKDGDVDPDETVFVFGSGRNKEEWLVGDILNLDGYEWKRNISWKVDYIMVIIPTENPEIKVLPVTLDAARKLKKEISVRIDELGDKKGNPFVNPYPFRLEYDAKAEPSNKYSVSISSVELTEDIEELFEETPPDISVLAEPSSTGKMVKVLQDAIALDVEDLFEDFPDDVSEDEDSEEKEPEPKEEPEKEKPQPKTRKTRSTKPKTKDKKKEEEPEKTKPKRRVVKKKEEEPEPEPEKEEEPENMEPCPSCDKMVPADATSCEHCGAEWTFEDDDDGGDPFE